MEGPGSPLIAMSIGELCFLKWSDLYVGNRVQAKITTVRLCVHDREKDVRKVLRGAAAAAR